MPSLDTDPSRHVIIDKRPGHYLSFPDVCLTRSGRLLCFYRQGETHTASRPALLFTSSEDLGRTFAKPRFLSAGTGHCPRAALTRDGRVAVIDDHSSSIYWSLDDGLTFAGHGFTGAQMPIPDRLMELAPNVLLTAAHSHRGTALQPKIRQAPAEQMTYLSENEGRTWRPFSVMANDPNLVLCEASMTRLPDGRILALLRENSFVFEPMYLCLSEDQGRTWSLPRPTPLIGHRPCLGLAPDGRLLVTYRNVGPDGGTAAWLGDLGELDRDFAVHGRAPAPGIPALTPEGLLVDNPAGPETCVRYALRPMTDPERATAELEAEVQVDHAEDKACAVHFGMWWRLFPDRVEPSGDDLPPIPVESGRPVRLKLRFDRGRLEAQVNDTLVTYRVDPRQAETRAILAGNASLHEHNGGRHTWRKLSLAIREPRYERDYHWRWEPSQGLPDAWAGRRVLELANDRDAHYGDFGYSGWTALPDGRFFCAYHHGGYADPDYVRGDSSHIRGTWFTLSDFTPNSEAP